MKVFGVELQFPAIPDVVTLVPVGTVVGTLVGALIQHITHGTPAPILGMGLAGTVATFLALSGAGLDAGWRGVALTFGGAAVAFLAGTSWA